MYLIWILVSRLIRSNNQSWATLWVLESCLIVGLLPLIIILITASLSSNTYNKASWRADWTFEGTASVSLVTLILFVRLVVFVIITLRVSPIHLKHEKHVQEQKRLDPIIPEQANPSNLSPMLSNSVELCENWSLFLAHPTYWNTCTTSQNAQCSSRSGFRIFKISRKSPTCQYCLHHGTSLTCVSSPNAFICVSGVAPPKPNAFVCVSPNAFTCVSPNAFTCVSPNAFTCVSPMRLHVCSPNAFICVSPNASAESTTQRSSFRSLDLCSLRSHVFQQSKLEFLSKEHSLSWTLILV